ncbi:MAG TPA: hypothetical protein VIC06_03330 [Solirubrobacteraceae bacterium]|jgi:hypothetical protein
MSDLKALGMSDMTMGMSVLMKALGMSDMTMGMSVLMTALT